MRRINPAVVVFVLTVSSAGCTAQRNKQKVCEHARDGVELISTFDGKLVEQDAPEDQKQTARTVAEQITATIGEGFVAHCLELDAADFECIAKIDDYTDAVVSAQRQLLNCRFGATDCERWEQDRREAEADYGEACVAVVNRIVSLTLAEQR